MNHTLEQISFEREHNLRRPVKGGCEKGWRWSWPSNCSWFSEAIHHLSGLQSLPVFLLSYPSRCPCTCCSTICQPTKTQRLWIVISVEYYSNQCGKLFELSHLVFSLICATSVFFQEQKFLVGVILMVPCYAVESVRCYAAALSFIPD